MNQEENSPWQYKSANGTASKNSGSTDDSSVSAPNNVSPKSIAWEASEYIDHPHGLGWYLSLVAVTIGLTVIVYLTSKDKIATGIIVIVGIIVGVFASHKPGQASYEITDNGLNVNSKTYKYSDFKSFAIIHEGALTSVNLLPLKRFMPAVSAYFDPADESKIMGALGSYLPYEERKLDAVERLSRRLRL
jgi:hypothetical protein